MKKMAQTTNNHNLHAQQKFKFKFKQKINSKYK